MEAATQNKPGNRAMLGKPVMAAATGNQTGVSRGGTESTQGRLGWGMGGSVSEWEEWISLSQQELHLACVRCWLSMLTS